MPLVGVVYEVTLKDFAHILATEGSTYEDILIQCIPISLPATCASAEIPDHEPFLAHTLLAPPTAARISPSGKPAQASLRYLTLCRTGAKEHNLPQYWQDYLDNLQHYEITSIRQRMGQVLYMTLVMPLFLMLISLRMAYKKTPKWLEGLTKVMFIVVWSTYDYIFRPVFGEGERTVR